MVFASVEVCMTEARKHKLKMEASRIPAKLQCVPGKIRPDGVIVEGDPPIAPLAKGHDV